MSQPSYEPWQLSPLFGAPEGHDVSKLRTTTSPRAFAHFASAPARSTSGAGGVALADATTDASSRGGGGAGRTLGADVPTGSGARAPSHANAQATQIAIFDAAEAVML